MQAVVPAAGEGTRMRPLTGSKPKALVEVADRPLLTHVFEALQAIEPSEYVVITGYRGADIREYYGDEYEGVPITYEHQANRNGLAKAVFHAEPHVSGDFVLLNGDNVIRANIGDLADHHRQTGAEVTALTERVSRERARKGAVFELEEEEITGIVEKPDEPPSRLVPRGCYALSPRIFDACALVTPGETGEYELTDALDLMLAAGRRFETVPLDGWCYNVNTPADCETVAAKLRDSPAQDR
jgi:dTDP-glucose pyrophosphorylase